MKFGLKAMRANERGGLWSKAIQLISAENNLNNAALWWLVKLFEHLHQDLFFAR